MYSTHSWKRRKPRPHFVSIGPGGALAVAAVFGVAILALGIRAAVAMYLGPGEGAGS